MTDTDLPPRLTNLTFHGPLSEGRAERLAGELAATRPSTVLDIGCGWGEFLLRVLDAAPGATGVGLDIREDDLARGRRVAEARGLGERAAFVAESALGTRHGPADVVLCMGSGQALCDPEGPYDVAAALAELRRLVTPGGRVLLGEGFWQRVPAPEELARMWPGAHEGDHLLLGALVDEAVEAGFRPVRIETATGQEWEDFESDYRSDLELWLAENRDHPAAPEIRARVDGQRSTWLNGYRDILGMAYLTLVPAG
ncbi:cyclopropane-fatty-acyl-phospholipid synthase family protein [Streptomyces sp. DH12]|uniref:SAM-dependent methyltransferase n=1 Tax=Streptomyces sp. DH12 TaxID=2857010 RepID=UPI001E2CE297|nr:class I SAM-dependent methyltransferase [Streptomyces sp. DH12]